METKIIHSYLLFGDFFVKKKKKIPCLKIHNNKIIFIIIHTYSTSHVVYEMKILIKSSANEICLEL